jgi:hypothetical protein
MKQRIKAFGAVTSLTALSILGIGSAVAAPLITSGSGTIDGYFLDYDCVADSCVDLASAGYTVSGGGLVSPSDDEGGLFLTPGSNSSDPADTLSYNVTSRTSQTNPAGSGTPIVISNLSGEFDFYWGSVDSYNIVRFFSGADSSPVWEISGNTLADALGYTTRTPANYNFDAYVSFVGTFDSVEQSSTGGAAFEVAAAVPEPGTLALLGLGLMGIGFARKRATA